MYEDSRVSTSSLSLSALTKNKQTNKIITQTAVTILLAQCCFSKMLKDVHESKISPDWTPQRLHVMYLLKK